MLRLRGTSALLHGWDADKTQARPLGPLYRQGGAPPCRLLYQSMGHTHCKTLTISRILRVNHGPAGIASTFFGPPSPCCALTQATPGLQQAPMIDAA
jgi:hypothetical protein